MPPQGGWPRPCATGRLADALRDLREAARRNPLDPIALDNAAQLAYRLGQAREAVQLQERLLQLQPNRLDIWKAAGAIYLYDLEDGENASAASAARSPWRSTRRRRESWRG